MPELPKYYTTLFNAVTAAIEAIDRQDYEAARALMVQGQQEAEELCISEDEQKN